MRVLYFFIFTLFFFSFCKPSTYFFSGRVTQTSEYCGGAAPSEALLLELSTPKPLANKKIYYRVGKQNNEKARAAFIMTDADGKFSVKLSAAAYVFFDESKLKLVVPRNDETHRYDSLCIYKSFISGDFAVKKSDKNKVNFTYNYHTRCFYNQPCTEYNGLYPPSLPSGPNQLPPPGGR